jgi:hypothetical protein
MRTALSADAGRVREVDHEDELENPGSILTAG